MFIALVTSLVVLFYCRVTADILTKLLQQCFLIFIVVPWLYLGNSQVSVYRTIGPTLVECARSRFSHDVGHTIYGEVKKLNALISHYLIHSWKTKHFEYKNAIVLM